MKMIELLKQFIDKNANSTRISVAEWLHGDDMQLYVRKSTRFIEGKRMSSLELANFEVRRKGKGVFSQFFKEAHAINPFQVTYVESVLNNRLAKWFERNGLTKVENSIPGDYYLLK